MFSFIQIYFLVAFALRVENVKSQGTSHLRNSYIEYCTALNPGEEKICRDAEVMKEFTDKQLRINGAFINYSPSKVYQEIVFGWGQCMTRPSGTYVKLLPWAMWHKATQIPFLVVISDTIDLFTSYGDEEAQIPLSGGKTHVFVLNGELRSFRGDIHRRCVAPLPDFHGLNEYHFEDENSSGDFMTKYTLTNKDKIFLGKEEMKECSRYPKMDPKRDAFLRKSQPDIIPRYFQKCKLECGNGEIGIIRARNGTGLVELDEDAGLHGVLVMYAMNETDLKFRENRIYPPNYNGMLMSMYDTEVELGEYSKNPAPTRSDVIGGPTGRSMSNQGQGRSKPGRRVRRDNKWLDELMESEVIDLPEQKRQKRLSYSSAVFMANTLKGDDGEEQEVEEMRCVG